jgi:hypothetical protein
VKYIVQEFAACGLTHTTTQQAKGIVTFQIPDCQSHVMAELPAAE